MAVPRWRSRRSPSPSSRTSPASRTPRRSTSSRWSSRRSSPGRGARSWPPSPRSCSTTSCSSSRATRSRSRDPGEWLNLVLLLFVGIVVGQLAALQRARAEAAVAREREARALFQVSRALATRASTPAVLPDDRRRSCATRRRWTASGSRSARTTPRAGRGRHRTGDEARRRPGLHHVLQRTPGDTPARGVRVHQPGASASRQRERRRGLSRPDRGRRRRSFGSIWGAARPRPRRAGPRPRPGCSPRPRTRSARRSRRTGSPPRRRRPRSPARATRSSRRCSSRCRTTCGRRSRRSAPPPGRSDPDSGLERGRPAGERATRSIARSSTSTAS